MRASVKLPSGLLRATGTSLHRQLFVVLRDQIARGDPAAGAQLPTEEELCVQFGVSRITVRRALVDLEAQGLVERRHGRGTFVRGDAPAPRAAPSLSLLDTLRKVDEETQVDVLQVGSDKPPAAVAALLGLPAGAEAQHALRVRRRGRTPVMVTEAWIPADLGVKLTARALRAHPLYELMMSAGITFGRVVQEISAEAADPTRAQLLQVELGAPLLRVTQLLHDTDARPVKHLTVHLTPERSRILMDIPATSVDTLGAGYLVHDIDSPRSR